MVLESVFRIMECRIALVLGLVELVVFFSAQSLRFLEYFYVLWFKRDVNTRNRVCKLGLPSWTAGYLSNDWFAACEKHSNGFYDYSGGMYCWISGIIIKRTKTNEKWIAMTTSLKYMWYTLCSIIRWSMGILNVKCRSSLWIYDKAGNQRLITSSRILFWKKKDLGTRTLEWLGWWIEHTKLTFWL